MAFCSVTVSHVASFVPDYVKAKIALAHVFLLFDMDSTIDAFEPNGECPAFDESLSFDKVNFAFPSRPDVKILKDISFTFDLVPGKSLGIIGSTGGKSTMLSLIERFYDVDSGQVVRVIVIIEIMP